MTEKPWLERIPLICVITIIVSFCLFSFCMYMCITEEKPYKGPEKKVGYGYASKIEYEGHKYVVWNYGFSNCFIHDPECQCDKKQEPIWNGHNF